jgi:hypothetical protein
MAMAKKEPLMKHSKPLNEAGLQKMAQGLSPQQQSSGAELQRLESQGWSFSQETDSSFVAIHPDKDLHIPGGQIFVRDNLARAIGWLERHPQLEAAELVWFRDVEVLNDVYCRKISDLSETDLHKALLQNTASNPAYGEALQLEIKLRHSQGIALPHYRRWRIEAATLTTAELTGYVKRANQKQQAESSKLQALRDELNSRLRILVDEQGVYAEDEESQIHQLDEPFVNARIVIRNTSSEVGWIYGYHWQRGSQFIRRPLTAGETFSSREAALCRAVEMVQQENAPDIEQAGPVQREGAAKLFAWAGSLVASITIVVDSSSQSQFDYDSLDEETRAYAQHATTKIRSLFRRTLEDVIAIGIELKEMKRRLKGRYTEWLDAEFPMSRRFAHRCMEVVDAGITPEGGYENVPISLIYELASESTPQEARQEIVRRAESGETITRKTVKKVTTQYQELQQQDPHSRIKEVLANLAKTKADDEVETEVLANLAKTEADDEGETGVLANLAKTQRSALNAGEPVQEPAAFNAGEIVNSTLALVNAEFADKPPATDAGQPGEEPAALNAGEDDESFANILKQQDVFISYSFFKDSPNKIKVAVRFGNPQASASYLIISFAEFQHLPNPVRQLIVDKQEALQTFSDEEVLI